MKTKKIYVTATNEPAVNEGLAGSTPCRIISARCVVDDPLYETWELQYVVGNQETERMGTPATLVSADRLNLLYWNDNTWRVTTPSAERVLDMVDESRKIAREKDLAHKWSKLTAGLWKPLLPSYVQ